jgi:hypothetical protein
MQFILYGPHSSSSLPIISAAGLASICKPSQPLSRVGGGNCTNAYVRSAGVCTLIDERTSIHVSILYNVTTLLAHTCMCGYCSGPCAWFGEAGIMRAAVVFGFSGSLLLSLCGGRFLAGRGAGPPAHCSSPIHRVLEKLSVVDHMH